MLVNGVDAAAFPAPFASARSVRGRPGHMLDGFVEWRSRIGGFVDVLAFHVVEIRVVPAHVGVDRRTLELSHMGVNIMVVTFGVIGHGCSILLYEDSIANRRASEGIGFIHSSLGRIDRMRNGVLRRCL